MFDDGIYEFAFKARSETAAGNGDGLALLRAGTILGSDRGGALFTGRYEFDPVSAKATVHVRMQVPPEGELVTGFSAGPEGALIDIVGRFDEVTPVSTSVIEVAGEPVELKLTYLTPPPN